MSVHVFTTSESNYDICIERGLVGLPEPKEGRSHDNVFDGLLSRLASIKENDFILMYVIGAKELRGVWQAEGKPFYDNVPVWPDRIYPFRCKIKCSEYIFEHSLKLDDINDLRSSGMIWTWALQRSTGSNSMFSLSSHEFGILLNEYMKANPFSLKKTYIPVPYPYHDPNVKQNIHLSNGVPKYEFSVMTLLNASFADNQFKDLFGNYSDFLCYVPTNLGKEMDILLMYENPVTHVIVSYDILEVKRDEFDEDGLKQLIGYESWFLQKKVSGDLKMVRTTAIAKSFSPSVIEYVKQRNFFEEKPIKLISFSSNDGDFNLKREL